MKILMTNDDGILAEGLRVLCSRFAEKHQVVVVAPDCEKSAVGHGITLHQPLRAEKVPVFDGCLSYTVSGTPADCVKLGMLALLEDTPDMVVSGINPGANVGANVNYSGTVAAAREAALYGVPGIAVGINSRFPKHYDVAAIFVERLAGEVFREGLPKGTCINVSVPDAPWDCIAGVRISGLDISLSGEYIEKRTDPRNKIYYWQGCDSHNTYKRPDGDGTALRENCIAVTPIQCDTTDYRLLDRMKAWPLAQQFKRGAGA